MRINTTSVCGVAATIECQQFQVDSCGQRKFDSLRAHQLLDVRPIEAEKAGSAQRRDPRINGVDIYVAHVTKVRMGSPKRAAEPAVRVSGQAADRCSRLQKGSYTVRGHAGGRQAARDLELCEAFKIPSYIKHIRPQ